MIGGPQSAPHLHKAEVTRKAHDRQICTIVHSENEMVSKFHSGFKAVYELFESRFTLLRDSTLFGSDCMRLQSCFKLAVVIQSDRAAPRCLNAIFETQVSIPF